LKKGKARGWVHNEVMIKGDSHTLRVNEQEEGGKTPDFDGELGGRRS
jgi:hypothetical protein